MDNCPKEKIPMTRAVAMVSFAFIIDALKFFFSALAITGPALVGVGVGLYATHYAGSLAGHIAGTAVAGSSYLFEFASGGIAAAGITMFGEFFATIIGFFGWVMIMGWLMLSGVKILSIKKPAKRLSTMFGTALLNLVPFINAGPWLTGGVLLLIRSVRKEDREERRRCIEKYQRQQAAAKQKQADAYAFLAEQEEVAETDDVAEDEDENDEGDTGDADNAAEEKEIHGSQRLAA